MTYDDAIKFIRENVEAHNKGLPKGSKGLKADVVIASLQKKGATTVEALRFLREQDLEAIGFPSLMARMIHAKVAEPKAADGETVRIKRTVMLTEHDSLRDEDNEVLLAKYQHGKPGAVADVLAERVGGRHVEFLFFDGDKVATDETIRLMSAIARGVPADTTAEIGGKAQRALSIDAKRRPVRAKRNPLYPNRPLLDPNELCEFTRQSYQGVGDDVRRLLLVAVQRGDIIIKSTTEARMIIREARAKDALTTLRQDYRDAAIDLANMPASKLPDLEIDVSVGQAPETSVGRGALPLGHPPASVGGVQLSLSGQDLKKLTEALQSSYPTRSALGMFLRFNLDKYIDQIADNGNLTDVIMQVIRDADAKGWIGDLIISAAAENAHNGMLVSFAKVVERALEARRGVPFGDTWREGATARIAICSVPSEEALVADLEKHLASLRKHGGVDVWHAGMVRPGEDANRIANHRVTTADIVVVLVSPRLFLDDRLVRDIGVVMQVRKPVIPVVARAVDLSMTIFEHRRTLPESGVPLATIRNVDAALVEVVGEIRKVIEQLRRASDQQAQPRAAQGDALARMSAMLPAQFEMLISKLGVPLHLIGGASAPQSMRAIDVLRWAQTNGRMAELQKSLL